MSRPASLIDVQLRDELERFVTALEDTDPRSLTACAGWSAHELVAHLAAGAAEIAGVVEAAAEGRPVPATRAPEQRELPYRAMDDAALRRAFLSELQRMSAVVSAVLADDAAATVPWTGRRMPVAAFVAHSRSELAVHRWDLVGDDEVSMQDLAQPELTAHAVSVLGGPLLARGAARLGRPVEFRAALRCGADQVTVWCSGSERGLRLEPADQTDAVEGDAAARLLYLWGRRPSDPRRLRSRLSPERLRLLSDLLAGY